MSLSIKWTDIKSLKVANSWTLYYIEELIDAVIDSYVVITGTVNQIYHTRINGADKTDFDTNFKSAAIEVISFPEGESKLKDEVNDITEPLGAAGLEEIVNEEFTNATLTITYNADDTVDTVVETGDTKTRTRTFAYGANGCVSSVTVVIT